MQVHRFSILILLLAAIPAFAQGPMPLPPQQDTVMFFGNAGFGPAGGGQVPDAVVDRVKAALALSDTQVSAVKALLNIRTQMNAEAFRQMQEKQVALESLLSQSNPNPTDVGNAFLATRGVEEKLEEANEKFRTDFIATLSPGQRTTLANIQAAAGQIEALTMMGLLEGSRGMFTTMAVPGVGPLPGPGATGAVRIERRARVVQ